MKTLLKTATKTAMALAAAVAFTGLSTGSAHAITTTFDVTMTGSSPTWDRVIGGGPRLSSNTGTFYETTDFRVDTSGDYDILSRQTGFDGYIWLYEVLFNPVDQLTNILAGDDDYFTTRMSFMDNLRLVAGTDYILVSGAYSAGNFGLHSYSITGPGAVTMAAVPLPAGGLLLLAALAGAAGVRRRKTLALA